MVLLNKKGSARDTIIIPIILLVSAFIFFIVKFSSTIIVSQIVTVPVIANNTNVVTVFNSINTTTNQYDYLFFGLFIALFLSVIITGWYLGGDAIYAVIYLSVLTIGVIGSMIMANIWYDVVNSSLFGATLSTMPITNHILSNLPVYTTIIGIAGFIAMYIRTKT